MITHMVSCSFLRQLGRDSAGRGVALCSVCVPGGVLKAGEDAVSRLPPASGTLRRDCPRSDTLWTRETFCSVTLWTRETFCSDTLRTRETFCSDTLRTRETFCSDTLWTHETFLFRHPLDMRDFLFRHPLDT